MSSHHGAGGGSTDQIHLPGPSLSPAILGLGVTILAFGVLFGWPLMVIGFVILLAASTAIASPSQAATAPIPVAVLSLDLYNANSNLMSDDPYLGKSDFKNFIPMVGGCDPGDVYCEDHPVGSKCYGQSSPCRCVADGRLCAVP